MIPHTLVLRPGLVIHSIYNGRLVLGTAVDCPFLSGMTSGRCRAKFDLTGT